jgi:competence protein ComGC
MCSSSVHIRTPVRQRRALTTTELIVTLFITGLLAVISIVGVNKARRARTQAVCAANLHSIGIGFQSYAMDFNDYFPPPVTTGQWEDFLRFYVHRNVFKCPADTELFPALGSSYDWRDTGNAVTTLAGKMHTQVARNDVGVAFDTLPGWHTPDKIQVLQSDQSIRMLNQDLFFKDLQRPPDR